MEVAGDASGETVRKRRGHPPTNAWPKGVTGNPHGRRHLHVRRTELLNEMLAEFGKEASPVDRTLLRQAALLLARAERPKLDPDIAIRMSGTALRILTALRDRLQLDRKREPEPVSLTEYLRQAEREADQVRHRGRYRAKRKAERGGGDAA